MRAAVVVSGDLGRSSRMQYHAHALAAQGVDVDLIGYRGVPLPRSLERHPRITVYRLAAPRLRSRSGRSQVLYAAAAFLDGLRGSFALARRLFTIPRPDVLLVQNPPALPLLHVAMLVSSLRGARFVIDWHNLGFSILALRLGRRHLAVRLARWLEMIAARTADGHLCVSRGFARFLADKFGIPVARVVYDRPASVFVPIEPADGV